MIPIRNRKKTLKVTVEEMRNFAFAYIEKYAPSKQQLKTYLLKKYLKTSVPNVKKQDVTNLIDIVLSDLEKSKFINDKFYSDSKAKSMIQRGNSINKIRSYLVGKGINDEFIKDTVNKIKDENSDQDFFSAIKICKKKRNLFYIFNFKKLPISKSYKRIVLKYLKTFPSLTISIML